MIDRRRKTTLAELWARSSNDSAPSGSDADAAAEGATAIPSVVGPLIHDPSTDPADDAGTRLLVLRGISGSGKSSLAKALQQTDPSIAWVDQRHLQDTLPAGWNDRDVLDTVGLIDTTVRFCLARGRVVVLEGILRSRDYGPMVRGLLADHPGQVKLYYLDVSVEEARRRLASLPAETAGNALQVDHSASGDLLAVPGETVIGQQPFETTLARLLADLEPPESERTA